MPSIYSGYPSHLLHKEKSSKGHSCIFLTVCMCLILQRIYGKYLVKYIRKITICTGVKHQAPRTDLNIAFMQVAASEKNVSYLSAHYCLFKKYSFYFTHF